MMNFYKYQGTGNDFVMVDNRSGKWNMLSVEKIKHLCDRRFGIGADGLIKINTSETADFEVDYYNSDGSKSFCGNGARCSVAFSHFLGIFSDSETTFTAIDGIHKAEISGDIVKLKMSNVSEILQVGNDFVLDTGSPHYIQYVDDIENTAVYENGKAIRFSENYAKDGINVNFVKKTDQGIFVRTYERGVEDETYSCGTGVTAAALTFMDKYSLEQVSVKTLGGKLSVYAEKNDSSFTNIWLEGPAKQVFSGEIEI